MSRPRLGILNCADARAIAEQRLPRFLFELVDRGAEDDIALTGNRAAFEAAKLRHRIMIDVSSRDASTTLFGRKLSMPVAIGPTGSAAMLWYKGETALARAAAAAGIPFTVACGGNTWFQLYVWSDPALVEAIVRRADAAGAEALIVTADTAVVPIREYNRRNGFRAPFRLNRQLAIDVAKKPGWATRVLWPYCATADCHDTRICRTRCASRFA
jgi:isopentenyl diphosphate isomerase/L-lactate dehydrogenase-like FMN-dependent dehydrogenase